MRERTIRIATSTVTAVVAVLCVLRVALAVVDAFEATSDPTNSTIATAEGPPAPPDESLTLRALAAEYGSSVSDISAYFDKGYTLDDIGMALAIAKATSRTLDDVIARGTAGDVRSWLNVAKSLGVTFPPEPNNPRGISS